MNRFTLGPIGRSALQLCWAHDGREITPGYETGSLLFRTAFGVLDVTGPQVDMSVFCIPSRYNDVGCSLQVTGVALSSANQIQILVQNPGWQGHCGYGGASDTTLGITNLSVATNITVLGNNDSTSVLDSAALHFLGTLLAGSSADGTILPFHPQPVDRL